MKADKISLKSQFFAWAIEREIERKKEIEREREGDRERER